MIAVITALLLCSTLAAQDIAQQLSTAIKKLETDIQFKHAILSLYVTDSKTGKIIFAKNEETGLAPASCQKVITSTAAFALLGKDFRYTTSLVETLKKIGTGVYSGDIMIEGNGDPSLGSNRYNATKPSLVLEQWTTALKKFGVRKFNGSIISMDMCSINGLSMPPRGYIWEDMGNYYGATTWNINWRENQYEVQFKKGIMNRDAEIQSTIPSMPGLKFINEVRVGEPGSGDNAYIFCAPYSDTAYITGTIPAGNDHFSIFGAMPYAPLSLAQELQSAMSTSGIEMDSSVALTETQIRMTDLDRMSFEVPGSKINSPTLDSLNYWFLKKSVNLYGDAFLKTMGNDFCDCKKGIEQLKNFWKKNGIDEDALNIIDGSGLSPANRVTTHALVTVMQYAKQQTWFSSFYNALPEMNGIKMKDGYINGVRSYTGYITGKSGSAYTFSFIVNNFSGNPGSVREKMWKLLDVLKLN